MTNKCICEGNWRLIVNETHHLLDREFVNRSGTKYVFFGIVYAADDYYYGMWNNEKHELHMLSCVGSFEGHGWTLVEKKSD